MQSNYQTSSPSIRVVALAAIMAASAPCTIAQTITVTTCFDEVDVPAGALIADLPGPDGVVSFREALRVSDNEPGRQTIAFEIPQANWYLPNIFPGQVLLEGRLNWNAAEPVTVDGTTQTAFTGNTFPDGNEICAYGLTVYLNGDGSELFGFHDSRITVAGAGSEVYSNTGGNYITALTGGSARIHDNEAQTIALTYSDDNLVVRNTTERVRVTGLGSIDPATGNTIGGPDPADRNFITGFGNYGQHGVPFGFGVELYYTRDTLIQNNYIGTTPDGMEISNPACTIGVAIYSDNHDVLLRDNLIATKSVGVGPSTGTPYGQEVFVELTEGGSGIEITGNTLGLNVLGEPVLAGVYGIWVHHNVFEYAADIRIGGPNPGNGNVIAGHLSAGVLMMFGPGVPQLGHVRLSGNSIYDNGDIGIDLMPNTSTFGVTPNDPLDADQGANGLQNFPELRAASIRAAVMHVEGTLDSRPNRDYRIEVFASAACDPSGHGQGEQYLGGFEVRTDGAGHAAFATDVTAPTSGNTRITTTAAEVVTGDTSEFSACFEASSACYADCDSTTTLDIFDFLCFQDAFVSGSPYADCTDDGVFDIFDFICFQDSFVTGCP